MDLAAQDDPGAETGADRQEDEVVDATGDSRPLLSDRSEVDVVLEGDGKRQALGDFPPELASLDAGDVGCERDAARAGLHHSGNADDDAVDELVREPAGLD